MKILKYVPLILTLLTSEQALAQRFWNPFSSDKKTEVKQNKTVSKEKTILHQLKVRKGDITPVLDSWSSGHVLGFSEIRGPFDMQLRATKNKKEIGAHIEYISPENVINAFGKSNPQFREANVRNFLNKYILLDPKNPKYKEIVKLFNDGKITEEEARKIGSLKDAVYYLPYLYRADNKEASLPGAFILHKYGSNFSYHELTKKKETKQVSQKPINVPGVGLTSIDSKLHTLENTEGVEEEKPSSLDQKAKAKDYFQGICGSGKKDSPDNKKVRTRLGLEAGAGSNEEQVIGAFVDVPLNQYLSIEGYGDFYAGRGNPIVSDSKTQVTVRERQLIGPGTYKIRTDEITTRSLDEAMIEFGLGLTFKTSDFEFPLRIGLNLSEQETMLYGKSTTIHERNMEQLGDPQVITNTKYDGKSSTSNLSLSQGALYNINKNLQLGGSYNRIGEKNSVRVNVRYKF